MNLAQALSSDASVNLSEPPTGSRMVSPDGRALLLERTEVRAEARGGLCRVVLIQRFENPHDDALEVTYTLPLPSDAAVSGFAFEMDGVQVRGVVEKKQLARERYEAALAEGRTAALLDQVRTSVFTQRVGNLPPRTALTAEITLDQPLAWLDEGAWEWRLPTVVGTRYMGAPERVQDASALALSVADEALAPRLSLSLTIGDSVVQGHRPESPSHALSQDDAGVVHFRAGAPVRLDRDVVVRWAVARPGVGLTLHLARGSGDVMHGLLTIVPPPRSAREEVVARDLIVLLDTSGSMGGAPLAQARRVIGALLDSLRPHDQIELIEFSSRPQRWEAGPVAATRANVHRAHAWLSGLKASGSTEMRSAILEALAPVRAGAQRQVVLVTDGYIGFEHEIVQTLHERLPVGCRLHTVGVGSSVNRSLLEPAARAGRGVEIIVGNDEDPERAVARILARTADPIVTDVAIECATLRRKAPARTPDLFQAAPAVVALELDAREGQLVVHGQTARGAWREVLDVTEIPRNTGSAMLAARFAREAVEDCEMHLSAGGRAHEIDPTIEALGLDFQIATRLTSWVAVTESRTVGVGAPVRRETVLLELPDGVSAEGIGLRTAANANATRAGGLPAGMTLDMLVAAYGSPAPQGATKKSALPEAPASMPVTRAAPSPSAPVQHASYEEFDRRALPMVSPRPADRRASVWRWVLLLIVLVVAAAVGYWLTHRAAEETSLTRPSRTSALSPRKGSLG